MKQTKLTQTMIKPLFLLALCGVAMSPAQAAQSTGVRVATGVGQWIAAQGNAALREIEDELKRDLADRLHPAWLPTRNDERAQEQPAR